ncbi:MAG: hypothetical protein AAGA05_11060 [Pseudomonadota bacterium]
MTPTAGLWLAVLLSGLYHGINPGMGWPLAVSSSLMNQRQGALVGSLGALAVGHFFAMLVILLPFAAMTTLIDWERPVRLVGGGIVISLGLWLLATRRHPRILARIPPSKLALWSFLVAILHGAALMLVPIYLGLCAVDELDAGHRAASDLMTRNAGLTLGVAAAHTAAMIASGGAVAFAVYRWLGLQFLRRGWFDLEVVWALSLILVGALGAWSAL